MSATPALALDHLVIAAATLAQGVAWCTQTFGIAPAAGGSHPMMGTHNALFGIASARFPKAYAEIIAIDPGLPAPAHPRWFDLDDAALQHRLVHAPELVHWVARCDDIAAARTALHDAGIDCGEITRAERATPRGPLRWHITVCADGRRALAGAAPALIAWGDVHPTDSLATSGVQLEALTAAVPELPALWPAALVRDPSPSVAPLSAVFGTPRGAVTLSAAAPRAQR